MIPLKLMMRITKSH